VEFLAQNQLYIVMLIVVGIWAGIFFYLTRLGARITKLEAAGRSTRTEEGKG
jgi:CcmD family protein